MDQVNLLINILLDKTASLTERDDAAMYLGEHNDDRALNALIYTATHPEDYLIVSSCGTSIAQIWVARKIY